MINILLGIKLILEGNIQKKKKKTVRIIKLYVGLFFSGVAGGAKWKETSNWGRWRLAHKRNRYGWQYAGIERVEEDEEKQGFNFWTTILATWNHERIINAYPRAHSKWSIYMPKNNMSACFTGYNNFYYKLKCNYLHDVYYFYKLTVTIHVTFFDKLCATWQWSKAHFHEMWFLLEIGPPFSKIQIVVYP